MKIKLNTKEGQRIYRWNIVRKIYDVETDSKSSTLFVNISPAKEKLLNMPKSKDFSFNKLESDDISWWETDENSIVEGVIKESGLLELLEKKNVYELEYISEFIKQKREIREDAVLLQILEYDSRHLDMWKKLMENNNWPNLSEFANKKSSLWFDFTKQARSMAKSIYKQLINENPINKA